MIDQSSTAFSIPDDVIRKRLLIDGDGGGDERRLNALMKLYIKWCNSSETDKYALLIYLVYIFARS